VDSNCGARRDPANGGITTHHLNENAVGHEKGKWDILN
jgi:hypothetical protein